MSPLLLIARLATATLGILALTGCSQEVPVLMSKQGIPRAKMNIFCQEPFTPVGNVSAEHLSSMSTEGRADVYDNQLIRVQLFNPFDRPIRRITLRYVKPLLNRPPTLINTFEVDLIAAPRAAFQVTARLDRVPMKNHPWVWSVLDLQLGEDPR